MKKLFTFLIALTWGVVSQAQYCDASSRCIDLPATNSDSLLFVQIGNNLFIPGNDCPAVTDNTGDTLYITTDGGLIETQNATYTDAVVTGWVDWNQNVVFDDDEFFQFAGHISVGQTGVLTLPDGVGAGDYTVRLKLWNSVEAGLNTPPQACYGSNLVYQNVDFILNVTDSVPTTGGPSAGYCAAQGDADCASVTTDGTTTDTTFTFIDRVAATGDNGGFNNVTNCDEYGNYTFIKSDWSVGNAYRVTVSVNQANLAVVGAVYIDWNKDTVFGPEETYPLSANEGDSMFVNILPTENPTGIYRMRVRTTGLLNTPEPCGTQAIGEVEDYHIVLRSLQGGEPSCVAQQIPSNGSTDVCTSEIFRWSPVADAAQYTVRITPRGASTPQYNIQTTDTFFIPGNGLIPDTTYNWIVVPENEAGTQAFGCDTVSFTTAPFADPVVAISPSNDPIITCKGSNQPLQGVVGYPGTITHTWTGSGATYLDNINSGAVVFNNPNEESVKLYYNAVNSAGCGGTDSVTITTLDGAQLDDFYLVDNVLCEADSALFVIKGAVGTVQVDDSVSGSNYQTLNIIQLNDSLYYAPSLSNGVHFLRLSVMLGDCDVFRGPEMLTFNSIPTKPQVTFFDGSNGKECAGGTVGMQVLNYVSTMYFNDVNNTSTDTLYTSGSGDFVVTNEVNGCVNTSDTLKARVFANPSPQIMKSAPAACEGDTLFLSVDASFAGVKWNINTSDSTSFTIPVVMDGTYNVDVVDVNGCEGSTSTTVSFSPKAPQPVITQLDPSPACAGAVVRLVASYDTAGVWNTGSASDTLFVTQTGNYIYTSITAKGCKTSAEDSISIVFYNSGDKSKVQVNPAGPYCFGDSVLLVSEFANGNLWNTGETNDSIYINQSGTYFVETNDENGCAVSSEEVEIIFANIPTKPEIQVSGNLLTSSIAGAVYEWTRDGIPLNQNKRTIEARKTGNYRLSVFNNAGCESERSEAVFITPVGIEDQIQNEEISVYPNPSMDGVFNIENEDLALKSFVLYTLDGKVVLKNNQPENLIKIIVDQKGMYLLSLETDDGQVLVKLIY
ncbi:T9SS type A sorting domain-containing protein [Luteibaculum oceani]|uniref:T9SS type A sorting domain-containing protein n=1 Tax=Luteibaculum oceani TaxID=1294296 RepID=A0A5C6VFD2_9FLAO|nr:T9SS type A sorting domain-containing protein [Luteibaculum oceani]TXC81998.1 T9SS type A sorting domain-containing protein [Luteibaculum oceani]